LACIGGTIREAIGMFASPFLKPRDAVTVLNRYRQLCM
jgi:hypothetical protein